MIQFTENCAVKKRIYDVKVIKKLIPVHCCFFCNNKINKNVNFHLLYGKSYERKIL